MRRRSDWVLTALFVAAVVMLSYAGWRQFHQPEANLCYACRRPIHAESRTIATVRGHPVAFCCPACARSERTQTGAGIPITALTDYHSGAPLAPDNAFVVIGSDVNPCLHARQMLEEDHRMAPLVEDRCSPSMLAFAKLPDAEAFATRHGGRVAPFRARATAPAR